MGGKPMATEAATRTVRIELDIVNLTGQRRCHLNQTLPTYTACHRIGPIGMYAYLATPTR